MKQTSIIIILSILLIPSLVFAQTNAFFEFMFRIDITKPLFYFFESSNNTINNINESLNFSAYWNDEYQGVDYYFFEWNISGDYKNSSANSFESGWSNLTKKIDKAEYEGLSVGFAFYGYDVNNNMNFTAYDYFNIKSEPCYYYNITQSDNNPDFGELVNISSFWTDNFNVYNITLQTNHSGDWLDNKTVFLNNITGWANFTWDTTDYSGETIWWRLRGFDNATNINITKPLNFSVN
jgi:hypothetical protein